MKKRDIVAAKENPATKMNGFERPDAAAAAGAYTRSLFSSTQALPVG
jgi:hypothetical protein